MWERATKAIMVVFMTAIFLAGIGIVLSENVKEARADLPLLGGDILYVGGTGAGNYTHIQDAIDNASDGDTVYVYDDSSPYYEDIQINRSINLIGENKTTTVIYGTGNETVVMVEACNVTIENFTIKNSGNLYYINYGMAGIYVHASNTTISHTILSKNNIGVFFHNVENCAIYYSRCVNNSHQGILINFCSGILIDNNTLIHNQDNNKEKAFGGIYLWRSKQLRVINNRICFHNNAGAILLNYCDNSTFLNNYLSQNRVGIDFTLYDAYNLISENRIENNSAIGVASSFLSHHNTISHNFIANNRYGIYFGVGGPDPDRGQTHHNIIRDNEIKSNGNGIVLYSSYSNSIFQNSIKYNGNGILILQHPEEKTDGNILYNNNLIGNQRNAYDECTNIWYNSSLSQGNYWEDYTGIDNDDNGIGDTPYSISPYANQDPFPLINEINPPKIISKITPQNASGQNGWYCDNATVELTIEEISGSIDIYYRLNKGTWQNYDGPVTVRENGINLLEYYSIDPHGYRTATEKITLKIDKNNPTIEIIKPKKGIYLFDNISIPLPVKYPIAVGKLTVHLHIADEISGLNKIKLYIDGSLVMSSSQSDIIFLLNQSRIGRYNMTIVAYDNAGNNAINSQEIWIFNP